VPLGRRSSLRVPAEIALPVASTCGRHMRRPCQRKTVRLKGRCVERSDRDWLDPIGHMPGSGRRAEVTISSLLRPSTETEKAAPAVSGRQAACSRK
jgi:hypothetical protein